MRGLQRERKRGGAQREKEREREGQRERKRERENSELYYPRIDILAICLFLHSVLANLHANTYKTTVRTLTTVITMMKITTITHWRARARERERERTSSPPTFNTGCK